MKYESNFLTLADQLARRTIALLGLAFVLGAGLGLAQDDAAARSRASKYPVGTAVQVHLRNHETISGQVEKYAGDGFWVKAEGQGRRSDRKIFYFEMQSINSARYTGPGQGRKGDQPRFSMDFMFGGTGGTVRVYSPKASGGSEDSH